MKIGFFNGYSIWGGGEKWHFEMSEYCKSKKDEVFFFTPMLGELARRGRNAGHQIIDIQIGKFSYFNPLSLFDIYIKIKSQHLDVLVFNSFSDVRAAGLVAKKAGVKKVILRSGMPIAPKEDLSFRINFRYGLDHFVPISQAIQDEFNEKAPSLLLESQKVPYIANGIDLDKFSYVSPKHIKPLVLGLAVRLSHQKGLDLLLASIKILKERGLSFVVKIAGEGELKSELLALSKKLEVESIVEFIGHVEDVSEFTQNLDIYLFTSRYEGTARSIIEAMACGKPVIAFNTSSMKEMVKDQESGFLVEPFSVDGFARKTELLINDAEMRERFGKNGKVQAEIHFNKVQNFQKWYDFLTL